MTTATKEVKTEKTTTALARQDPRLDSIEKAFRSDYVKQQIEAAIPKHAAMMVEQFLRVAQTSIQKNPKLIMCSIPSLLSSTMQAAQLGLMLDGVLGHGYLVPFFNKKKNCLEATFIPGYKGYIDLAFRSGTVSGFSAEIVRKGDLFEHQEGTDRYLKHVRNFDLAEEDEDLWVGVYCAVVMKDGYRDFEYLTRAKVERSRRRSKSSFDEKGELKNDAIWATDAEWMWKKTAFRQIAKRLRLSPQDRGLLTAATIDELAEAGKPEEAVIDIPASLLPANEPTPKGEIIHDDERPTQEEPQALAQGDHLAATGEQQSTTTSFVIRCTFNTDKKTALISGHTDFVAERMKKVYGAHFDKELGGYILVASLVSDLAEFCEQKGIQFEEK